MFLLKVCAALNAKKIPYAVVGGYAVALHGAVRGTVDLDLILSLDEPTYVLAEQIFKSLGLQSRLPVDGHKVFQFRKEYIQQKNLVAWSFFDPVHAINQLDIIITHDAKKMDVDTLKIHGVIVKVVSLPDLIKMKKASARAQDLEDVKALEGVLRHEKS